MVLRSKSCAINAAALTKGMSVMGYDAEFACHTSTAGASLVLKSSAKNTSLCGNTVIELESMVKRISELTDLCTTNQTATTVAGDASGETVLKEASEDDPLLIPILVGVILLIGCCFAGVFFCCKPGGGKSADDDKAGVGSSQDPADLTAAVGSVRNANQGVMLNLNDLYATTHREKKPRASLEDLYGNNDDAESIGDAAENSKLFAANPDSSTALYTAIAPLSVPATAHLGQTDSQASTICAYASANGNCNRQALSGGEWCALHKCPSPGCTESKSSQAKLCATHINGGTTAPTGNTTTSTNDGAAAANGNGATDPVEDGYIAVAANNEDDDDEGNFGFNIPEPAADVGSEQKTGTAGRKQGGNALSWLSNNKANIENTKAGGDDQDEANTSFGFLDLISTDDTTAPPPAANATPNQDAANPTGLASSLGGFGFDEKGNNTNGETAGHTSAPARKHLSLDSNDVTSGQEARPDAYEPGRGVHGFIPVHGVQMMTRAQKDMMMISPKNSASRLLLQSPGVPQATAATVECSACGVANTTGFKFCQSCGAQPGATEPTPEPVAKAQTWKDMYANKRSAFGI